MKYIHFNEIEKYGYLAIQTTKQAGDMKDKFNLNKILTDLNISENCIKGNQKHTTNIYCIEKNEKVDIDENEVIDGFISNDTNYTLITYYADCLPIFLLDPTKNVFGVLHGGWRGSANKILEKGIGLMLNKYKCKLENILVCFGIGISGRNYEIKEDTVDILKTLLTFNNMITYKEDKIYLDTQKLNEQIAKDCGILEKNIFKNNYCTTEGDFYSYRKTHTPERMVAIITKKR